MVPVSSPGPHLPGWVPGGKVGAGGSGLSPEGNRKPWAGLCYTTVPGGCYEEGLGSDGEPGGEAVSCAWPGGGGAGEEAQVCQTLGGRGLGLA